jgi:tetratricopeptide (TPR) repeat protein
MCSTKYGEVLSLLLAAWFLVVLSEAEEVEISARTFESAFNEGNTHLQAGDPAAAALHYSQAIAIQPTHSLPYVTSGIAYFQMRQHEEAELHYKKAVELEPQAFHGHFNRGNNWVSMGLIAEAIKSLQSAVDASPNEAQAQAALEAAKKNQRAPNFQLLLQTNMQLLRQDEENLIISHYASEAQGHERMGGWPVKRTLPNMAIPELSSEDGVSIVERPPWCNSAEELEMMDRLVHRHIPPSEVSVQVSRNLFVGCERSFFFCIFCSIITIFVSSGLRVCCSTLRIWFMHRRTSSRLSSAWR